MPSRRGFIAATALAVSPLIIRSNSVLAQGSANTTTFANAWAAFNNRDWATLAGYLAQEVALVKIKSNHSIIGKSEVLHYMKTYVASDVEKFDPTGGLSSSSYTPVWNASYSVVTGTADWQDKDSLSAYGTTTILPIFYRFRFNGNGKIDRMYGSPD
jgi:hypothetical protein